MYMCFDDSGLGVKSQSNSAMAGSCRNIPKYSLVRFDCGVKLRNRHADPIGYGVFSNSEPAIQSEQETGLRRKVVVRNPKKGDNG